MWVLVTLIGLMFVVSPVTHKEKGCMAAFLYVAGSIFTVLGILLGIGVLG